MMTRLTAVRVLKGGVGVLAGIIGAIAYTSAAVLASMWLVQPYPRVGIVALARRIAEVLISS